MWTVVCQLNDLSTAVYSQEKLKQNVGKELTAYAKSCTRCRTPRKKSGGAGRSIMRMELSSTWTFCPLSPNEDFTREILTKASVDFKEARTETAIAITDQSSPGYRWVMPDWPVSNPKGYLSWFQSRMGMSISKMRASFATEPLPDHWTRTPLQLAIQIIKRHRDLMFENISDEAGNVNPDDKPISIILTTLATHAYRQETTIREALDGILNRMDRYIKQRSDGVWIANPSHPLENFADRWRENPHLQNEFNRWLARARQDYKAVTWAMSKSATANTLQGRFDKPSSGDFALTDSWTDREKIAAKIALSNAEHKRIADLALIFARDSSNQACGFCLAGSSPNLF